MYYQPYWTAYCDAHKLPYDHHCDSHCEFIIWIGEKHREYMPDAPRSLRGLPAYRDGFIHFLKTGERAAMSELRFNRAAGARKETK